MTTTIERVAVALYGASYFAPGAETPSVAWLQAGDAVREKFRGFAKAAILAMREPDDDMPRVASFLDNGYAVPVGHGTAIAVWQVMIDEALK